MGAALRTLVEKKAQGESSGEKGKLSQDKIKKNHKLLWTRIEDPQEQQLKDEKGGAGNFVAHDVDRRSHGPQPLF